MSRTLSRLKREGGISLVMPQQKRPHLALRGESPGFSRLVAANLGSPSSYDWDRRDPLVGASGTSSLQASCAGPLGSHRQPFLGLRSSSGVEAGTSGFLSLGYMDVGVPLGFPQWSQASSRVETCMSTLLSSLKSSVRLPVGLIRDRWLSL